VSFAAIILVTLLYLFVAISLGSIPAASGFFGHSLGILGFLLMLIAETLYTLRKRSRSARWGRMSSWLEFHVFTGIVGPYLVLLHSSWKFQGLAGVVLLLTGVMVLSGFFGRFVYTAVPRTPDGVIMEAREIGLQIQATEEELQRWEAKYPESVAVMRNRLQRARTTTSNPFWLVFGRRISNLWIRFSWYWERRKMMARTRAQVLHLEKLFMRERVLQQQLASLEVARKFLAAWYIFHVPVGLVLFAAAVIHIIGAIYFGTLLT
jgi:hypothetical protein